MQKIQYSKTASSSPRSKKKTSQKSLRGSSLHVVKLPLIAKKKIQKPLPLIADSYYNYQIASGNNSRIVLTTFRRRPWWRGASEIHPTVNFIWEMYRNPMRYNDKQYRHVVLNHIQHNQCLVTKKGLYKSLRAYCEVSGIDILSVIPHTYFIHTTGSDDYEEFVRDMTHSDRPDDMIWIVKPASVTNRGFGIKVIQGSAQVLQFIGRNADPTPETPDTPAVTSSIDTATLKANYTYGSRGWIVQKYMIAPLLVAKRKFDVRCYVLVVLNGKQLSGYFYEEGYVRTSCKKYSLKSLDDRETHLTNDAVQKKAKSYGKFEQGNKLSYAEWQEAILRDYPNAPVNVVHERLLPGMKRLASISLEAGREKMRHSDVLKSFEILGYDFMFDENFKPYLIEINSNPCMEFVTPMLENLLTSMMENAFSLAIDQLCPPPALEKRSKLTQEAVQAIESFDNRFEQIL